MPLNSKNSFSETELTQATQEYNHADIDNDANEGIVYGEIGILCDAVNGGQADIVIARNDAVDRSQTDVAVAGNDEADIGFKVYRCISVSYNNDGYESQTLILIVCTMPLVTYI